MTARAAVLALCVALGGCYQSHERSDGSAPSPADLCTATGGRVTSGCCDWHCGDVCTLRCVREVCTCPSSHMAWDPVHGCVVSPACMPVRAG